MNKKAGVLAESFGNFIFIPVATVLLIVIFITFLFLFSSDKPEIRSLQTNVNTFRLLTLLKSPVEIQDVPGIHTISDLVIYSSRVNDYSKLESQVKSKFDRIYDKNKCPGSWSLLGYSTIDNKQLFSIGKLRSSELSYLDYNTFFVKPGVLIFTGVDVDSPVAGYVVLPIDQKNLINLTLYVGC